MNETSVVRSIEVELDITHEGQVIRNHRRQQFIATKVRVDQWSRDGFTYIYLVYFGDGLNTTFMPDDGDAPACVARHLAQAKAARFS